MIAEDFLARHTNHVLNPSFEAGAWALEHFDAAAGTADVRVVRAPAIRGAWSLRVGVSADATDTTGLRCAVGWTAPTVPGAYWTAAAMCGFVSSGCVGRLDLEFLSAVGTALSATGAQTPQGQATPGRLYSTGQIAPENTARVRVRLSLHRATLPTGPGQAVFDDVLLTDTMLLPSHTSGDSGGQRWIGDPWWSPSARRGAAECLPEIISWMPPWWSSDTLDQGSDDYRGGVIVDLVDLVGESAVI